MKNTDVEYRTLDSVPYLILKRKIGSEKTDECAFCGKRHIHGRGEGHRIVHCLTGGNESVVATDGTILYKKDGYIIINY